MKPVNEGPHLAKYQPQNVEKTNEDIVEKKLPARQTDVYEKQPQSTQQQVDKIVEEGHLKQLSSLATNLNSNNLAESKNTADNIYSQRNLWTKFKDYFSFIFGKSDIAQAYDTFIKKYKEVKNPDPKTAQKPATASQNPPQPIEADDSDNSVADTEETPQPIPLQDLKDLMIEGEPRKPETEKLPDVELEFPEVKPALAQGSAVSQQLQPAVSEEITLRQPSALEQRTPIIEAPSPGVATALDPDNGVADTEETHQRIPRQDLEDLTIEGEPIEYETPKAPTASKLKWEPETEKLPNVELEFKEVNPTLSQFRTYTTLDTIDNIFKKLTGNNGLPEAEKKEWESLITKLQKDKVNFGDFVDKLRKVEDVISGRAQLTENIYPDFALAVQNAFGKENEKVNKFTEILKTHIQIKYAEQAVNGIENIFDGIGLHEAQKDEWIEQLKNLFTQLPNENGELAQVVKTINDMKVEDGKLNSDQVIKFRDKFRNAIRKGQKTDNGKLLSNNSELANIASSFYELLKLYVVETKQQTADEIPAEESKTRLSQFKNAAQAGATRFKEATTRTLNTDNLKSAATKAQAGATNFFKKTGKALNSVVSQSQDKKKQ